MLIGFFSGAGIVVLTLLYRLLGQILAQVKFRKRNKYLEGKWVSTFTYNKNHDDKEIKYVEVIALRIKGTKVLGKILEDKRNYLELKEFAYKNPKRIEGELFDNKLFSGQWFHPLSESRFFGVFQMTINFEGTKMEGRWLGYRESSNEIDEGKMDLG